MKVCIISYLPLLPLTGGSSIRVKNYVTEFAKNHEVTVIAPFHADLDELKTEIGDISLIPVNEIKISRFEKHRELRYLIFAMLATIKCLMAHRKKRFDILVAHNVLSSLGPLLIRATDKNVRTVFDMTDLLIGFFSYYAVPKTFKRIFESLGSFEISLARKFDLILTVSHTLKEFLLSKGFYEDKVQVVTDGINVQLFSRSSGDIRSEYKISNDIVVAFMGMIDPYQGVDVLISAAKIVLDKFHNAKFIIIGKGTAEGDIKHRVEEYGLTGKVIFTGWIKHEQVPLYINSADICAITHTPGSSNEVLFPIKLIEYWAMGKPVVVPNLMNMVKLVKDGQTALIYRAGDHIDLAAKISILIEDSVLRKKIGDNARTEAYQKYDWHNLSKSYVDKCLELVPAIMK